MNIRTNLSIALVTILITIAAALVATVNTDNTPIKHYDGIEYIETADAGLQQVTPESYTLTLSGNIESLYGKYTVAVKVTPQVNTDTPKELPNTSAPHGSITCTVVNEDGSSYQVTRESCDDL